MDRKVLIALGLSVGIIWFWTRFVMIPPPPESAHKAGETQKTQKLDGGKTAEAPTGAPAATGTTTAADGQKPEAPTGEAPKTRQPESFSTVEVAGRYRAQLSSWGAALHDFTLLDPRYQERSGADKDEPIDLVTPKDPPLPFSVTFPDSGFQLADDADFELAGTEGNERRYVWTQGGVRVTKRYTFVPNSYEVKLEVTVENTGDKPVPAKMRLSLSGRQDPGVEPSLFKPSVVQTEGVCSAGKVKRESLSALRKEALSVEGPVRFVAVDRKYFAMAAAIGGQQHATCHAEGSQTGRITASLTTDAVTVAPGGKQTWTLAGFAGPKVVAELDAVKLADGTDAHLGDLMNYGFTEIFARPMLWVLKKIHQGLGNWGIAIILLTLLIKLITWWPTAQSMKSAAQMAKLKPEMDKLREKYGDDKARMNQEVMALYTKHKINPLGGCLPVLIQMPIYIALYSMLGNSVELYRASFGLWIHDLTAPDPYFVLPLATGGVMFLQQKLSPTPPDPQQKTMMTMMPIMFTGMSIFLPAGLTVYILTNTALSMIQQRISTPPKKD